MEAHNMLANKLSERRYEELRQALAASTKADGSAKLGYGPRVAAIHDALRKYEAADPTLNPRAGTT